ncbi:hypothetical protein X777_09755 [Ooceraea biroi]|uniref:Uncharacterized protein n=1 Tax=Ooceraea biroi TaxID=2015173 RepID=A0A026W7F5_OOCBI|nr:hypothetical protein X777_09755 [Ooceraea biroi]
MFIRILGRRYALTATGYKYLDIGINVGPPSYVEIAIGDHRGNELILFLETWKGLYEQQWDIQNRLRKDVRGRPITVGPLTVRFSAMNDNKLVCLDSSDVRLMMTESTFFTMINLDRCIELTYAQLDRVVEKVDTKFVLFSNIASAETKDASNAIRASECFNDDHIIDCELLALVFEVMYDSNRMTTIEEEVEEEQQLRKRQRNEKDIEVIYADEEENGEDEEKDEEEEEDEDDDDCYVQKTPRFLASIGKILNLEIRKSNK